MNRYRVRALFPPGEELDRLGLAALKERTEKILGAALDELGRDGRELDEWERLHLATAIAYLHAGLIRAALMTTWWSLMAPGERTTAALELPPAMTKFPMTKFRQAFEYARHSSLGPFANDALDRRAWLDRVSQIFTGPKPR